LTPLSLATTLVRRIDACGVYKSAQREGLLMATKRSTSKARIPKQQFGRLNKDGTVNIQPQKLEGLKKKVGKAAWSRVRFVALNAPFKRRSPISPT
jgi:hypothetical protein